MPFFRRRTRFSATPRRSWRRRAATGTGTRETRRQYAQMVLSQQLTIEALATSFQPSFLIQALTPWANGPDGGFDRAWELKGLVWDIMGQPVLHTIQEADTQNLYDTTVLGQSLSRVCAMFFVDQADASGAPVSQLDTPNGPFVTTAPIASPTGGTPNDDQFMPTRILKRKTGTIQTGESPSVSSGQSAYIFGVSNFRWSGAIRKRISVASRQGLYLGFFGIPPLDGFPQSPSAINSVTVHFQGSLFYYYTLRR